MLMDMRWTLKKEIKHCDSIRQVVPSNVVFHIPQHLDKKHGTRIAFRTAITLP